MSDAGTSEDSPRWSTGVQCLQCDGILNAYLALLGERRALYNYECPDCGANDNWFRRALEREDKYGSRY